MTPLTEARSFTADDPGARAFFDAHGYVVVSGLFRDTDLERIKTGWDDVVRDSAASVGLEPIQFVARFPQNRDLWRKSRHFEALLFDTPQAWAARSFLGVSGVRLFHDHAICKPAARSGTIPWHQDSAYWPLDRVGLSLWTATEDVPPGGGCLKVLDGSHRDGPGAPQDFLSEHALDRDRDPRLVMLPVRRGETVVLDGLTWHGSDPNTGGRDRLAYLSLWVPATSRFVPAHAGWHPTAAHVGVGAGERLEGDWFPLFGEVAVVDEGRPVSFPAPARSDGRPSMFTASRDIAEQIAWLLGEERRGLGEQLVGGGIDRVAQVAVAAGLLSEDSARELREVLADLELQDRVRRESVARDVYLGSVVRWWRLLGGRISEARRES